MTQKARQFNMNFLAVFGSYARNEQTSNSDLDLVVQFHESPSLIRFIQIENDIADALNLKVDLVTKNSLNKYIRDQILAEMQVIYSEV
ncbi:MAG: type VII toxin-antitoxin system MntA family adenylyltransferase antitoxin [Promethearchaeota archaeon]